MSLLPTKASAELLCRPPGEGVTNTDVPGYPDTVNAAGPASLASRLAGPAPERLPRHPHRLSREDVARSQRGRILRAVAESVAENGYAATSVADVIARAGVSRSTFYELYDGKESAFLDAYSGIELVHRHLLECFRAGETPAEMVRAAVRDHLASLASEPAFTWMFFVEAVAAGPRILNRRREATEGFLDVLTAMVGLARQRDPRIPPPDRALLLAFVGSVRELVANHLLSASAETLPDLEDDLVAVALRLLLAPAENP
jgi:AcrR family transcriptional regulator